MPWVNVGYYECGCRYRVGLNMICMAVDYCRDHINLVPPDLSPRDQAKQLRAIINAEYVIGPEELTRRWRNKIHFEANEKG